MQGYCVFMYNNYCILVFRETSDRKIRGDYALFNIKLSIRPDLMEGIVHRLSPGRIIKIPKQYIEINKLPTNNIFVRRNFNE